MLHPISDVLHVESEKLSACGSHSDLWKRNCILNAQSLDVENEKYNVTIVKLNVELYNVAQNTSLSRMKNINIKY